MKKIIIRLSVAAGTVALFVSSVAFAQNYTIQELQNRLRDLQNQIQSLQNHASPQIDNSLPAVVLVEISDTIRIERGGKGDDVENIQTLLILKGYLAIDQPTKFFGPLTEAAVKKLQSDNNLPPVGRIGPLTAKIVSKLSQDFRLVREIPTPSVIASMPVNTSKKLCIPPGWNVSPSQNGKLPHLPQCKNPLPPGIQMIVTGGSPGAGMGNDPSTDGLQIMNLSVEGTTATTTHIVWVTNHLSNSRVWYSTVDPVQATSTTPHLIDNAFGVIHNMIIPNLTPGTTYYFKVGSTDTEKNKVNSAQNSFTTLAQ